MNSMFICKYDKCSKYLLDPILLKCSNNVCKSHVEELIKPSNDDDNFNCFVCHEQHKMPSDGFISNIPFNDIMLLNLHLNKDEKKAADLIEYLETNCVEMKKITNDPENYIFELIADVRNKIDLERERLIQEINSLSNKMLDKLNKFENECKQNLTNLNDLNEQHKEYFSKLSNDVAKWKEEMRTPNIDDDKLQNLIDDVDKFIEETSGKVLSYKNDLLMKKSCSFIGMNTEFDNDLFGNLFIEDLFNSPILKQEDISNLLKLCKFEPKTSLKLLYQATKDGFSANDFHLKCDGIPNTLSIIKVKGNANVFGGFCSEAWDQTSGWKNDPNAFIFSLIGNQPIKINVNDPKKAMYCDSGYFLEYGDDISISSNSNENHNSYSNLGFNYKHDNFHTHDEAKTFLAGSNHFATEEIEVFQVI